MGRAEEARRKPMPDTLHARLVASLNARLDRAREQAEDPQRWPREIWWSPDHHAVTVEVNGAKTFRTWLVRDHGDLRTTWEWHPPADAYLLLDPATEIRRVEALLRVVERHVPYPHPTRAGIVQCDYCAAQCHSRSGLACDSPADAIFPCADIRDLAAGEGIEVET